jgi:signal transduction histidine kinase
VIWNLLDNAIKFTSPGGRVEVEVSRDPQRATLEMRDTGPGIPEERLGRVFERFYRVDGARTRGTGEGGTGLGLAIVKAIVELHEGSVEARNRPTGGAAFRVSFPTTQHMLQA